MEIKYWDDGKSLCISDGFWFVVISNERFSIKHDDYLYEGEPYFKEIGLYDICALMMLWNEVYGNS